jgi:hypothetical protein
MTRLLCVVVLLVGCGWTPRQKLMGATMTTLLVVDWKQTYTITGRCTEDNPVLGDCGQRFPVTAYFPMVIMTALFAAELTPAWREVLMGAVIGAQGATVWDNATGTSAVPLW